MNVSSSQVVDSIIVLSAIIVHSRTQVSKSFVVLSAITVHFLTLVGDGIIVLSAIIVHYASFYEVWNEWLLYVLFLSFIIWSSMGQVIVPAIEQPWKPVQPVT